jgi:hypothetical protein
LHGHYLRRPKNVSWGVQSLGTYRGLPLYVDESEYQDTDGSMKPFVPVDNVLVAPSSLAHSSPFWDVCRILQTFSLPSRIALAVEARLRRRPAIAVAKFPRCVAFSRDEREKGGLNRP